VAETTLGRDQGGKLSAYASGGITVYWIVNLVDLRVEVYSGPCSTGYQTREDFIIGQDLPVIIAGVERGRIAVSEILA
jgi:Uma2 family endonuclease